jgi:light-regulated signal transduction histidine kinase (bacteriophytochrome)
MEEIQIPWSKLAGFIRKHTHDVRNDLNSIDLESAFLEEVVPPGEMQAGIARIRKQVRSLSGQMRLLSSRFQSVAPIAGRMPAKALLTIWQERRNSTTGAPNIQWSDHLDGEQVNVNVDVEMMGTAFQELLTNAAAFPSPEPVAITATADNRNVMFEMQEPKSAAVDPGTWGQPFFSTRHGCHGLGLWTTRRLVEANKGTFDQQFVPAKSALVTCITLPRVP